MVTWRVANLWMTLAMVQQQMWSISAILQHLRGWANVQHHSWVRPHALMYQGWWQMGVVYSESIFIVWMKAALMTVIRPTLSSSIRLMHFVWSQPWALSVFLIRRDLAVIPMSAMQVIVPFSLLLALTLCFVWVRRKELKKQLVLWMDILSVLCLRVFALNLGSYVPIGVLRMAFAPGVCVTACQDFMERIAP